MVEAIEMVGGVRDLDGKVTAVVQSTAAVD